MKIRARYLIYTILMLSMFQYIFRYFIPINSLDIIFSQLDDIFLFILFSLMLFDLSLKQENFFLLKTPLNIFLILIFLIMLYSFILNASPIFNLILTLKNYLLVFVLYYFIVYSIKIEIIDILKIVKFLFILSSIQFISQIFEFIFVYNTGTLNDDSLMGTFSGANNLGYALFMPIFLLLTLYINKMQYYMRYLYILLISLFATFAEFAIISVPFFFILYRIRTILKIQNLKKIISMILTILIIFGIISIFNPQRTSGSNSIFRIFSPEFLVYKLTVSEFDVYSGSARMLWFPITLERLNDRKLAASPWIGMGPGMYASFAAFKTMPYTNKSIYNAFGQIEKGLDPNVDSQLIPIWGEFGYIGLFIFLLFYLYLAKYYYKISKKTNDIFIKSLNITASASSLYLILGMYVNHILETQTIMTIYVLIIALAQKSYQLERTTIAKNNLNTNTIN